MFGSSVYWLTPSPTFYLVTHRLTIDLVNTPSNAGNPNSYEYAIFMHTKYGKMNLKIARKKCPQGHWHLTKKWRKSRHSTNDKSKITSKTALFAHYWLKRRGGHILRYYCGSLLSREIKNQSHVFVCQSLGFTKCVGTGSLGPGVLSRLNSNLPKPKVRYESVV